MRLMNRLGLSGKVMGCVVCVLAVGAVLACSSTTKAQPASDTPSQTKQADARITLVQANVPVLVNRQYNLVAKLTIQGPGELRGLTARCGGGLRGLFLAPADDEGRVNVEDPRGLITLRERQSGDQRLLRQLEPDASGNVVERTFACEPARLDDGEHVYWLLAHVSEQADLDSRLVIEPTRVRLGRDRDGVAVEDADLVEGGLRLGYRLRHRGDDGSQGYRIPGLVRTNDGTLLGCYDIRRPSNRDLQGDMDIGISRSTDGGRTWEPMRVGLDMGQWGGLPEKYNGVSDAGLLVDRNTGRVFVFGCWMHGLRTKEGQFRTDLTEDNDAWSHQWHGGMVGSGPGMTPRETCQMIMAYSDDDGQTWSDPINITQQIKDPSWYLVAPAPGSGITLADGTLVMPAQGRDEQQRTFSTLMVSHDHGETWAYAPSPARLDTTECTVVQLADGSLMLNMRDNRNRRNKSETNGRAVAVTHDLGETWEVHSSDHRSDLLPESTCMAHLLRVDRPDGHSVLVFSNPNNRHQRTNQTIKVSFDEGVTWPAEHWVELDAHRGAGYSCKAAADDGAIVILYESSQGYLVIQRVSADDLGLDAGE